MHGGWSVVILRYLCVSFFRHSLILNFRPKATSFNALLAIGAVNDPKAILHAINKCTRCSFLSPPAGHPQGHQGRSDHPALWEMAGFHFGRDQSGSRLPEFCTSQTCRGEGQPVASCSQDCLHHKPVLASHARCDATESPLQALSDQT